MDIVKLKVGDQLVCPHCQEPYPASEGFVEDYVIPGKTGGASQANEQCINCDEWFSVTRISDNEFEVDPVTD